MVTPVRFRCDVCRVEYPNAKLATQCEQQPKAEPSFKPGQIVLCKSGFGWYEGARHWIENAKQVDPRKTGQPWKRHGETCPNGDGNCFGPCCTFQFFYVVTAVDLEPFRDAFPRKQVELHRWRYHLATMAMPLKGYGSGYTFDYGHYAAQLVVKPPRRVVKESKALVGRKADSLI